MSRTNWIASTRRHPVIWLLPILCLAQAQSHADGIPPVPADYPSHVQVGDCTRAGLEGRLQAYNETRLELAAVLRKLADEADASPAATMRLRGYAESLDEMRDQIPAPDPDSDAFRNFDFRLGIMLTSMTLFLNTADEKLTRRFEQDRDDPNSALGLYLVHLEQTRSAYMDGLTASRTVDCS